MFLEHSRKVESVTQVKTLLLHIIAVIQMATGSFAKFLGICGLANFWIIAREQITNCAPVLSVHVHLWIAQETDKEASDSHDTTDM